MGYKMGVFLEECQIWMLQIYTEVANLKGVKMSLRQVSCDNRHGRWSVDVHGIAGREREREGGRERERGREE